MSYRDKRDLELVDFFARALRDIDKLSQEEIEDIIYCGFQEYEKQVNPRSPCYAPGLCNQY